jgi:TRAP-type C4-dicarboxylate transport system substrate-binding protein
MNRKALFLASVTLLLLLGTSPSLHAKEKQITLNWVSFVAKNNYIYGLVQKNFVDRVNEQAKGELLIKFRGGPETFTPFDIPKAVQNGTVDMGTTFVGAIEPIVRGLQADMLTQLSLDEERKPGGAYDFVNEMYKKNGLYYLGRGLYMKKGFFYTVLRNKKVERPADLKGLSLGGTTAAQAPALAWGCAYTPIPLDDAYSALERGIVDGIQGMPASGYRFYSIHEISKYIVDNPIYNATVRVFMNLKSFNGLPKHLQALIIKTFIEGEKEMSVIAQAKEDEDLQWMLQKGPIKLIKFSPQDAKVYVDAAYNSAWDYQQKRFPEITPKLRELFSK